MCHYITLVVSGSDKEIIDGVMKKFGRRARGIENQSVTSVLFPEENQYLAYAKNCDCGTVLSYHHNIEVGRILHDTEPLKAKGWSNSKIERWLEDKSKKESVSFEEAIDSVELWKSITSELLNLAGVKSIGLLLHNYEGSLLDEEFTVKRRTVDKVAFDASLVCFNENELLMATKPHQKAHLG